LVIGQCPWFGKDGREMIELCLSAAEANGIATDTECALESGES
jgi:hypothetical protein